MEDNTTQPNENQMKAEMPVDPMEEFAAHLMELDARVTALEQMEKNEEKNVPEIHKAE